MTKSGLEPAAELVRPMVTPADSAAALTFAQVFRQYAGYVLTLLRRLGVREADVEDVAQEVFVVVHAQLPGFEGRSTVKTWLCGIALRKASEHRRKAYRRRERPGLLVDSESCPASQERELAHDERRLRFSRALQRLSEKQRQVFVLYELEELSMAEVARAVGCPRFTAYTRLYSARRVVREAFADEQEWQP